jgi:hypothetical protein
MVDDYFWGALLFSAQFSSDLLASAIFDNALQMQNFLRICLLFDSALFLSDQLASAIFDNALPASAQYA